MSRRTPAFYADAYADACREEIRQCERQLREFTYRDLLESAATSLRFWRESLEMAQADAEEFRRPPGVVWKEIA